MAERASRKSLVRAWRKCKSLDYIVGYPACAQVLCMVCGGLFFLEYD